MLIRADKIGAVKTMAGSNSHMATRATPTDLIVATF
jgi:hypothetical protein